MFKHQNIFDHENFLKTMLESDIRAQHELLARVFTRKWTAHEKFILQNLITDKGKAVDEKDPQYRVILFLNGVIQYLSGQYEQAVNSFQQSAEKGFIHGYMKLAMMYRAGKHVNIDLEKSVAYLEKALSISTQKPVPIPLEIRNWTLANLCSGYFRDKRDMFTQEAMTPMRHCYDDSGNNALMKNLFFSLFYLDSINMPGTSEFYIRQVRKNIFAYIKEHLIVKYLGTDTQSLDEKRNHFFSCACNLSPKELKYFLLLLNTYADKAGISSQENLDIKKLISLENWSRDPIAAPALRHLAISDPVAQYWLGNCYLKLMQENSSLNTADNRELARKCFKESAKFSGFIEKIQDKLLLLDSLAEVSENDVLLVEAKNGVFPRRFFPQAMNSRDIKIIINQSYPELLPKDGQLAETVVSRFSNNRSRN